MKHMLNRFQTRFLILEKEKVVLEQKMSSISPQDSVQLDEIKKRNDELQEQNKLAQSELIKAKSPCARIRKDLC